MDDEFEIGIDELGGNINQWSHKEGAQLEHHTRRITFEARQTASGYFRTYPSKMKGHNLPGCLIISGDHESFDNLGCG